VSAVGASIVVIEGQPDAAFQKEIRRPAFSF
jgi:hypothetical protein